MFVSQITLKTGKEKSTYETLSKKYEIYYIEGNGKETQIPTSKDIPKIISELKFTENSKKLEKISTEKEYLNKNLKSNGVFLLINKKEGSVFISNTLDVQVQRGTGENINGFLLKPSKTSEKKYGLQWKEANSNYAQYTWIYLVDIETKNIFRFEDFNYVSSTEPIKHNNKIVYPNGKVQRENNCIFEEDPLLNEHLRVPMNAKTAKIRSFYIENVPPTVENPTMEFLINEFNSRFPNFNIDPNNPLIEDWCIWILGRTTPQTDHEKPTKYFADVCEYYDENGDIAGKKITFVGFLDSATNPKNPNYGKGLSAMSFYPMAIFYTTVDPVTGNDINAMAYAYGGSNFGYDRSYSGGEYKPCFEGIELASNKSENPIKLYTTTSGFKVDVPDGDRFTIRISNVLGQKVAEKDFISEGEQNMTIKTIYPGHLASGVYIATVMYGKHTKSTKITLVK